MKNIHIGDEYIALYNWLGKRGDFLVLTNYNITNDDYVGHAKT